MERGREWSDGRSDKSAMRTEGGGELRLTHKKSGVSRIEENRLGHRHRHRHRDRHNPSLKLKK